MLQINCTATKINALTTLLLSMIGRGLLGGGGFEGWPHARARGAGGGGMRGGRAAAEWARCGTGDGNGH